VFNKEIEPPFKPIVINSADVRNFDKEFTDLPPILTPLDQPTSFLGESRRDDLNLRGFSYIGDPTMLENLRDE
jgi:classical protein kinase C